MQGVIEVERDVADLDDLLHQSHDSQRPMQTVGSLYANFYAIANPRQQGRRPGFAGVIEVLEKFLCNMLATIAQVVRTHTKKPARHNVLRASNRGARGRLEVFAMVPLSAGVRVCGPLEMPLNLPLKRELPSRRAHYGSEAQLPGDMLDRLPGPQMAASCILQLFLGTCLKLSSQRRSLAGDQRCQVWRNALRLPAAVVVIQVVAIDRAHSYYPRVLTRLIVPAVRIRGADRPGF